MYVARLGDGFIVKRMPETGGEHALECASHGAHIGSDNPHEQLQAEKQERPEVDTDSLKLGFPLTAATGQPTGRPSRNAYRHSAGKGLSLDALLRLLWDRAGLNEWHPAFAGRRTWAVVRWRLLKAAAQTFVREKALSTRLYVPEPFSIANRDAINARRLALWHLHDAIPGKALPLMLLIGEVKAIVPDGHGVKAIVRHVPDQAFDIGKPTSEYFERRFLPELALWGRKEDMHMLMIATFSVAPANFASIHELSLMPVTRHWLPFTRSAEQVPRSKGRRMIENGMTCS